MRRLMAAEGLAIEERIIRYLQPGCWDLLEECWSLDLFLTSCQYHRKTFGGEDCTGPGHSWRPFPWIVLGYRVSNCSIDQDKVRWIRTKPLRRVQNERTNTFSCRLITPTATAHSDSLSSFYSSQCINFIDRKSDLSLCSFYTRSYITTNPTL